MYRLTAFPPPGTDGGNIRAQSLLLRAVRLGCQPYQRVQRHLHPWTLLLRHVLEVGVDAAEDGLVGHDEDVFAALEFHDDGFETDHNIAVRLPAQVTVVVLVIVAGLEVVGIPLFDLGVGEAVANAAVEFVESFPLELLKGSVLIGLCV